MDSQPVVSCRDRTVLVVIRAVACRAHGHGQGQLFSCHSFHPHVSHEVDKTTQPSNTTNFLTLVFYTQSQSPSLPMWLCFRDFCFPFHGYGSLSGHFTCIIHATGSSVLCSLHLVQCPGGHPRFLFSSLSSPHPVHSQYLPYLLISLCFLLFKTNKQKKVSYSPG